LDVSASRPVASRSRNRFTMSAGYIQVPAQAPVVMQAGSVTMQVPGGSAAVQMPGASVSVPQYSYPGGSVEVPVYSQQVSVQRLYHKINTGVATVTTPQPITFSGGNLTPEQLKMIFPMGAPENFAPSAPAVTMVSTPAPASVVVSAAAVAPVVSLVAPTADPMPAVTSAKASKKKSSKKSKKKKSSKGLCC